MTIQVFFAGGGPKLLRVVPASWDQQYTRLRTWFMTPYLMHFQGDGEIVVKYVGRR